ncbi:MAG: LuxR family transcriptional regulator [Burkholderiales bacterium]|nr:LuxR family transcriptional regulator [Burkholderiales bacterium]
MPDVPCALAGRRNCALSIGLAQPLADAAASLRPQHIIRELAQRYGLESVSYLHVDDSAPRPTGRVAWTTLPAAWGTSYASHGWATIDPRLARTRNRLAPLVWDAGDFADDPAALRFFDAAAHFRLRSGVAIALHQSLSSRIVLTFDSTSGPISPARREAMAASQGDLMLIAISLHEDVLVRRLERPGHRAPPGPRLTLRERDCLSLAARGFTSVDIGDKLNVAPRTVDFHFGNIKTKLCAQNRTEAIAKGIAFGIVDTGARGAGR